jgi:Flp pilus assembly protein TadG
MVARVRRNRLAPSPPRRRRGQAMVEMAIVATVLMVLAFGIIDFGIYFYRYVQAANCVREAARRAAVRADDAEDPPYCVDAGLSPTVTEGYADLAPGTEVTATIDTTHSWLIIGYLVPGLGSDIAISASTSMRMEGKKI